MKMSSFKFSQKEIRTKDFHNQRQLTDILTINANKVVLFDKLLQNNRENWWCIVGYQGDKETIIPLFMKTPKNIFSYGVS